MKGKVFFKILVAAASVTLFSCGNIHYFSDDIAEGNENNFYTDVKFYYTDSTGSNCATKRYLKGTTLTAADLPGVNGYCTAETETLDTYNVPAGWNFMTADGSNKLVTEYTSDGKYISYFVVPDSGVSLYGSGWTTGKLQLKVVYETYSQYSLPANFKGISTVDVPACSFKDDVDTVFLASEGCLPSTDASGIVRNWRINWSNVQNENNQQTWTGLKFSTAKIFDVNIYYGVKVTIRSDSGNYIKRTDSSSLSSWNEIIGMRGAVFTNQNTFSTVPPSGKIFDHWLVTWTDDDGTEHIEVSTTLPEFFPEYDTTYMAVFVNDPSVTATDNGYYYVNENLPASGDGTTVYYAFHTFEEAVERINSRSGSLSSYTIFLLSDADCSTEIYADDGIRVYIYGKDDSGNEINRTLTLQNGTPLFYASSGYIRLDYLSITNNDSLSNGNYLVGCAENSTVNLNNCNVDVSGTGSAFAVSDGTINFSNCESLKYSGGSSVSDCLLLGTGSAYASFNNCAISGCESYYGAVVWMSSSSLDIEETIFSSNTAVVRGGGSLYLACDGWAHLKNGTSIGNALIAAGFEGTNFFLYDNLYLPAGFSSYGTIAFEDYDDAEGQQIIVDFNDSSSNISCFSILQKEASNEIYSFDGGGSVVKSTTANGFISSVF